MTEDIDRALGSAWRDDSPYEFLTDLLEIGDRLGGHPGEARAAERVAAAFEAAGVDGVRTDHFGIQRWDRGDATLRVTAPVEREFETIALPYSPPGEVSGPIVDVGHGTAEEIAAADLDGAVALASTDSPPSGRFIHRMEKFGMAADGGAEAFVFANHVQGQLPPTGALRFDAEARMPGVGVSAETGHWLREYAERGGEVAIDVSANTSAGESQNVVGELGPDTDDAVVLLGHYDAHDIGEGALDNGCGIAVVTAAARLLAGMDLDRRVLVAGVGCEELGLMGSEALAADLDRDSVAAVVNVDGAGRFRDLVAMTHASDDVADAVAAVEADAGQPIAVREDPHPYSDHWPFLRAGVPALQLHSDSGERGRGWGHTSADTRDKVDPRNLREHGMLAALLVAELCGREPAAIDHEDLRAAMEDQEFEPGMRAAEIWPDLWE